MRLEVRTFGGLAERAGLSALVVELSDGADVGALRRAIAHMHPELAPLMPRVAVSVGLELVPDTTVLDGTLEIALLPPVAGGAGPMEAQEDAVESLTVTGLVHGPLDIESTLGRITSPDVGAVVSFLGTVRDHAEDLDGVVRLEYSAYEAMAERELACIAGELRVAHPEVRGLVLLHALGELEVGAHTILVAASSAHRAAAFDACREALELIKVRVPVFKREITGDGTHRWVGLSGPASPGPTLPPGS